MSTTRTPIIAGNWKMYKTAAQAKELVTALKSAAEGLTGAEIVVCPTFTSLATVAEVIKGSNIKLGAQNVHWEKEGAFTGEIAASMLTEIGVEYVVVGHSERRQYFGETNETVNKRARAALDNGLKPIVCVGETLAQREAGQTSHVVTDQVMAGLAGFSQDDILRSVIAYEPVWAIGTGKTASPEQAQEVHELIRCMLEKLFGAETAGKIRLQYGGSVKPANARELMSQKDIDGALVGGASLEATSFAGIVKGALSA